jgi:lysophospholipase L1-like esterase
MHTPGFFQLILLGGCCLVPAPVPAVNHDGDINADGAVDMVDLLWGYQALMNTRTLGPLEDLHADVAPLAAGIPAPDGTFNLGDVAVLLRMLLGDIDFTFPGNQFNSGDSIGEGEAADNTIGEAHHENVWSTGYEGGDSVNSFNERFEAFTPAYYENNASRDALFNQAASGAVMADFEAQAQAVAAAAALTPSGVAGAVTVLLGNNDVCAPSLAEMTDPVLFEAQFRAGLDELAAHANTRLVQIHVSGLPAIYWLWNANYTSNFNCRLKWPFVPCQNLLANAGNDCESSASREDPDTIYQNDGPNCVRRKQFHALIRDVYNPILRDVVQEYRESGVLPNARYTDIFDVRFDSGHINTGDCFHPSRAGHALLADTEWCRTHWGLDDAACTK